MTWYHTELYYRTSKTVKYGTINIAYFLEKSPGRLIERAFITKKCALTERVVIRKDA